MARTAPAILFLSALLLIQLQASSLTLGALSGIAFSSNEIWQTAVLACVQTAALGVAAVFNVGFARALDQPTRIFGVLLAAACASLIAANSAVNSPLWYAAVFSRLFLGYTPAAKMVAMAARLINQSAATTAKRLQVIQACASLVGLAAGPVMFARLGIAACYFFDVAVICLSAALYFASTKLTSATPLSTLHDRDAWQWGYGDMASILAFTLPVWIAFGVVNIVETPFLILTYKATPEFVSAVFFATSLAALLTTLLAPARSIAKAAQTILASSGIALIALGIALLLSHNSALLFVLSVMIGMANAIFNLSGQNIVQSRTDATGRALGFLALRLALPIGMVFSSLFIYTTSFKPDSLLSFYLLSIVCISLIVAACLRLRSSRAGALYGIMTALVLAIASLTAHSKIETTAEAKVDRKASSDFELRLPLRELPVVLDPSVVVDASAALVEHQIFQGLYEYSDTNSLLPVLAKSHVISPDGRTFTISIDPTKTFSDGTALDADLVRRSLVKTLTRLGDKAQWAFGNLEGFTDFTKTLDERDLVGLKVKDKYTLEVKLTAPFAQFLQVLTSPNFVITHGSHEHLVGTGAYEVEAATAAQYVLRLRPGMTKGGRPLKVVFVRSPDFSSTLKLAEDGLIDVFQAPSGGQKDLPGYHRKVFQFLQVVLMFINTNTEEFKTKESRCHFAQMVKSEMMKSNDGWLSASKGLPYGWDFFDNKIASNDRCSEHPHKIFYTNSAALFPESQLARVESGLTQRGCSVSFEKRPVNKMFKDLNTGRFAAAMIGFVPDYLDPDALLYPVLKTNQLYNWSRYSNQATDALLDVNRQLTDGSSRSTVIKSIVKRMEADCPISVLGSQPGIIFYSKKFAEPKVNGLGFHMLTAERIRLKETVGE